MLAKKEAREKGSASESGADSAKPAKTGKGKGKGKKKGKEKKTGIFFFCLIYNLHILSYNTYLCVQYKQFL